MRCKLPQDPAASQVQGLSDVSGIAARQRQYGGPELHSAACIVDVCRAVNMLFCWQSLLQASKWVSAPWMSNVGSCDYWPRAADNGKGADDKRGEGRLCALGVGWGLCRYVHSACRREGISWHIQAHEQMHELMNVTWHTWMQRLAYRQEAACPIMSVSARAHAHMRDWALVVALTFTSPASLQPYGGLSPTASDCEHSSSSPGKSTLFVAV